MLLLVMVLSNVFESSAKKVNERNTLFQPCSDPFIGCDINAQDNLGQTAAHYSAMHNHVDTLKYLTNIRHIDLSLCNNESKLPIHYGVKHGSKNVLNLLLQSNLTIYGTDQHGNTIAHEASEHNQLECMKLIWKQNQNLLAQKNHLERTPSHTVCSLRDSLLNFLHL
jgi:ankyrin repeat protein